MKTQSLTTALAFLVAAFMWGCQEQASSPIGPEGLEPQLKLDCALKPTHPQCQPSDKAINYEVTFASGGDITTNPETLCAGGSVGGGVHFPGCEGGELILTSALLVDVGGAADQCFGGISIVDDWRGRLVPDKKAMNQVEAVFLFQAKDKVGINPVRYRLILAPGTAVGSNENDVFPPEPGTSMTVTYSNTFKIEAQRKKEKNACSSDGFISLENPISVEVVGIS